MAASKRKNPAKVMDERSTGYGMIRPGSNANRTSEAAMDSTEKRYVASRDRTNSSYDAVRKARKANKKKPID